MRITARELNRSTLGRQLLLRREPLGVVDGVRRVVALQAQEAASPYLALWNRLSGFDPASVDAAFASKAIVKATLMRITLHAVDALDYPAFRNAMVPVLRAARLDSRFTATGLTVADAEAMVPELLAFADRPRTTAEITQWLAVRLGSVPDPAVWRGLRSYAPLLHVPGDGLWSFGVRPSYVASGAVAEPSEVALRVLVRRYLSGFGPASVADVAQFALVARGRVREALDGLPRLEGPDGVELFDVPDGVRPDGDAEAPPRLMAMWDSVLLAYADRSRVVPPEYRKVVTRANGDVLPTLLVDGQVAGVWRVVDGGIEATAFHRLAGAVWEGLAQEARGLLALLAGREPGVYRRYSRWWAGLPGVEVRVLPGE